MSLEGGAGIVKFVIRDRDAKFTAAFDAAQDAFTRAYEEAVQLYGKGDQAYRAAFTALKQRFEKRGDQWIAKHQPSG